MAESHERRTVEEEMQNLMTSLDRYASGDAHLSSQVVTDLSKAIHEIGNHLVNLQKRIDKLEESTPKWTTKGWEPPPEP